MSTESERLYRINDVLTDLASEFGVAGTFETDEDYDGALNEATHRVGALLRIVTGEASSADASRSEQVVWRVTAADADAHAGRRLTDDELARLARAIGHSSIPDALDEVVFAVITQ